MFYDFVNSQKSKCIKKEAKQLSSFSKPCIEGITFPYIPYYNRNSAGQVDSLSHLISTHAYSHLNNVYICKYTGYLSVMLNYYVGIQWRPFPILEIFRFIVPDFYYIWPWNRISCQMHIFSTKSIWKGEKKSVSYLKKLGNILQGYFPHFHFTNISLVIQAMSYKRKQTQLYLC